MKISYGSSEVEKQCKSLREAQKLFGGNKALANSLLSRVNAIDQATVIKDIIRTKPFRFHKLEADYNGLFAIDVKTIRDKWRIILQPLDSNDQPYDPCHIDEIADVVTNIKIKEVSGHYE